MAHIYIYINSVIDSICVCAYTYSVYVNVCVYCKTTNTRDDMYIYYVYFYSGCISPITLQHPHDSQPSNGHGFSPKLAVSGG